MATDPRTAALVAQGKRRISLSPLGVFVDGLIQTFENCRLALKDETLGAGPEAAEGFFLELYEKERPRLVDHVHLHDGHLGRETADALAGEIDTLLRTIVVPAYARLAAKYTAAERNEFFLARPGLHPLERVGWAFAGILAGLFVHLAPFIPVFGMHWLLIFFLLGLFFPALRGLRAVRTYELRLNELVHKADQELDRIDAAYVTRGVTLEPEAESRRPEPKREREGEHG